MTGGPVAAAGAVLSAASAVVAGAPVRPDAGTARELAQQELDQQAYRSAAPGLAQRVVEAVLDALDRIDPGAGGGEGRAVAVLVLLPLVAVALVLAVRATGRSGRVADRGRAVLAGAPASAAELRRRADEAASREDWAAAVTERFRAVVRALQERDLVPGAPGLTAAEAASRAAAELPGHADDLRAAAGLFDAVAYGGDRAGPGDDARLRELDESLARARPAAPAPGAEVTGARG